MYQSYIFIQSLFWRNYGMKFLNYFRKFVIIFILIIRVILHGLIFLSLVIFWAAQFICQFQHSFKLVLILYFGKICLQEPYNFLLEILGKVCQQITFQVFVKCSLDNHLTIFWRIFWKRFINFWNKVVGVPDGFNHDEFAKYMLNYVKLFRIILLLPNVVHHITHQSKPCLKWLKLNDEMALKYANEGISIGNLCIVTKLNFRLVKDFLHQIYCAV